MRGEENYTPVAINPRSLTPPPSHPPPLLLWWLFSLFKKYIEGESFSTIR